MKPDDYFNRESLNVNLLIWELETLFRVFLNDFLYLQAAGMEQETDFTAQRVEYREFLKQFSELKRKIVQYDPLTQEESIQKEGALSILKSFALNLFRTFGDCGENSP